LARGYDLPAGFKRIYFYHVRKTAGTSLNHAFFALCGQDGGSVQALIGRGSVGWVAVGDYVFVAHNNYLAETGDYFYGYAHTPAHQVRLQPQTFRFTCLRDPVRRVVSHYRNLVHFQQHVTGRRILRQEGAWLGQSIADFLDNIPAEHLQRQLYMFSKSFDVNEAVECLSELESVMFTEHFDRGLAELSQRLRLDLQLLRSKSTYDPVEVDQKSLGRLREMLDKEYLLLDRVRARFG
jgi:hypothetical protein